MRHFYVTIFAVPLFCASFAKCADRPNILWLSCEDISPHLACYGVERAITPTLDQLANNGTRYTHVFTTCGVCATNRSSIITGMYPSSIGTMHMRCQAVLPKYVKCFPEYLRQAGYYCTNNSKTDYNFPVPKGAWDESSRKAHWHNRDANQPFFAVFNFTNTHESKNWLRGAQHRKHTPALVETQRQNPGLLQRPTYYPDTNESRRDWANYFENITQMDYHTAHALHEIDVAGLADNTIIFFWSDHGVGLPRGKRWVYDSGTHVPMIVYIPPKFRVAGQGTPGSVSNHLISFIDLAPTVLNLAGIPIPSHIQGRAFLGPNPSREREFVVSVRDRMDERYDIIRAVRDKRYRYIRNFMNWKPYSQHLEYAERNETMKALRHQQQSDSLLTASQSFMSRSKPPEELYDLLNDPFELANLATSGNSQHLDVLQRMRQRLQQWTNRTQDLRYVTEPELDRLQLELGSRRAIGQQPNATERTQIVDSLLNPQVSTEARAKIAAAQLAHPDSSVRYWSAIVLGNEPTVPAKQFDKLKSILAKDPAPIVQVAAARAVGIAGNTSLALEYLVPLLSDTNKWVRLAAAIELDEMEFDALNARSALTRATKDSLDKYVIRVAEKALRDLAAFSRD